MVTNYNDIYLKLSHFRYTYCDTICQECAQVGRRQLGPHPTHSSPDAQARHPLLGGEGGFANRPYGRRDSRFRGNDGGSGNDGSGAWFGGCGMSGAGPHR